MSGDLTGIVPIVQGIAGSIPVVGGVLSGIIGGLGGGGGTTGGPQAAMLQIYGTDVPGLIHSCLPPSLQSQYSNLHAGGQPGLTLSMLPLSVLQGTASQGNPGFTQLQPFLPGITACTQTGNLSGAGYQGPLPNSSPLVGGFTPAAAGALPGGVGVVNAQMGGIPQMMQMAGNAAKFLFNAAGFGLSVAPLLQGTHRPVFNDQGQETGTIWAPVTYMDKWDPNWAGPGHPRTQIIFPGRNNGLWCAHRTGDFAADNEIACMTYRQGRFLARQAWGRQLHRRPSTHVGRGSCCRRKRSCC